MNHLPKEFKEEASNSWTHLVGVVFALSCIWTVWPAASLGWQWTMGVLFFIAKPVYEHLSTASILLILTEGLMYTVGTYFFARDTKRHYHAVWHVFVLLGAIAHWTAILLVILGR